MIPALIIAIVLTFVYMLWTRYRDFNARQIVICKHALQKLLIQARSAGESQEKIEILLNVTIDTYNETVRGPWFYKNRWKIPRHEYEVKKNETQRYSKRRHSDSQVEISKGKE